MEISPDDDRPAYSGYFNAMVAPAALLPLAGAALIEVAGSSVLFAVSAIAALLQWVLVRHLRKVEGGEAMMQWLRRILRRAVAHSWLASRFWYRLHGLRIEGGPEDEVWYFAYGANMHDSAFRVRRGMRPRESRAGRIQGYRLRFNLQGRPIGKAAPANISPDAEAEVWGVLYKLTCRDLVRLDSTEGVPGPPYRHLWLDAQDIDGRPLEAVTYIAAGKEKDGNPSLRYITLLREGARAHGLPQHWLSFLDSVRHAE